MSRSIYARLARRFGDERRRRERRAFLRAALAAAAAGTLGLPALTACRPASPGEIRRGRGASSRHVIIVGAGLAGLACADALHRAGITITVVEARPRVGGRVSTLRNIPAGGGAIVEAGGEFIGSNHPAWLGMAQRFGLPLRDADDPAATDDGPIILLAGRVLGVDEARALYREMTRALAGLNEDARRIDPLEPWSAPDAGALDRWPLSEWIRRLGVSDVCRQALAAQFTIDNGVIPARQSTLANLAAIAGGGFQDYWEHSEDYRCAAGNDALASRLAGALPAGTLRLEWPAARIEMRRDGVRLEGPRGQSLRGDDVVLAVPPSVWPAVEFDPPLPEPLAPQMGASLKQLFHLDRRAWLRAPDALTDAEIGMVWEATANQPAAGGPVVTAFTSGPACDAVRLREPGRRRRAAHAALELVIPGFVRRVRDERFIDWPGERWTRAGYSFPAPGEVTTLGPMLRAGVPGPGGRARLHFAGEHCCPRFVGYMEGALTSGQETAARLIAAS